MLPRLRNPIIKFHCHGDLDAATCGCDMPAEMRGPIDMYMGVVVLKWSMRSTYYMMWSWCLAMPNPLSVALFA